MKLFKILMYSIIAAIAVMIVSGTLTSCHSLKKSANKSENEIDSLVTSSGLSLHYDSAAATHLSVRDDSAVTVSTGAYKRKKVVEEFEWPTINPDSVFFVYGDSAAAFWRTGHLKKRTTTYESGTTTKTKKKSSQAKDSSAAKSVSKNLNKDSSTHKSSRIENESHENKDTSSVGRGWIWIIVFVTIILGALWWLDKQIPD